MHATGADGIEQEYRPQLVLRQQGLDVRQCGAPVDRRKRMREAVDFHHGNIVIAQQLDHSFHESGNQQRHIATGHIRYADGSRVFEHLNLRLDPGQRVGLVGPSGSGKSTLFALLQRFYDLHGGRILLDGQDISQVTQESLRAAIAVVPQDISLFHRSALENIRYGRPDASDREVLDAALAARCGDFLEALPGGLETIVGERGVKLSGGQRQRIAIARAFLKDAPLLLLDEATSALDGDSEEAIREALGRLLRGRTVIAIAHRLSTVRHFDRVVVLHAGEVAQDGPPDHLARHNGLYRSLVQREMSRLAQQAA